MISLEDHLAQAICNAFWETAEDRRTWATSTPLQREVFRLCAEAAIKAGREYREMQGRAAA
jgi:hypothetical protein